LNKKISTILWVIGIIGSIGSTYFVVKNGIESDAQFKKDMHLLDREDILENEEWDLYWMYDNGTISKNEYKNALQNLHAKFDSLLEEGYENRWDDGNDASYFFQMIDLSMEGIERKIKELE